MKYQIWKMELGEVVNPHYAFPVVGVILCVLLVFAFGFKSPTQPPSFDNLQEEKKPVQKRRSKTSKSKDNKVKSQQNGRIGNFPSSNKQVTESNVQQTTPVAKSSEKQTPKAESKNKKARTTSNTLRHKSEQVDVKNKTKTEDIAEDGWVQQLSKKERKHRRKEEVANASSVTETDKNVENESWNEQPMTELSSCSQESTPSKGSPKQLEKNTKENITQDITQELEVQGQKSSKKKAKKDAVQNETCMIKKYEEPPVENKKSDIKSDLGQYDVPNFSIQINHEMEEEISGAEDNKFSKKKKGKKKNQETNISIEKEMSSEEIKEKASTKLHDDSTSSSLIENIASNANSTSNSLPKYEDKNDDKGVNGSGTNVIFDELGDIQQDAKSQKKKKKARRDQ